MQANRLQRPVNCFRYVAVRQVQRFPRARKLQERIDEVGHQIYSDAHLLVQLFTLCGGEMTVHQELGIGHDRCE